MKLRSKRRVQRLLDDIYTSVVYILATYQEESKEEAIRRALRAPKKAPEKDKKEEPEYENFEEEIKDIGPKFISYAKALLVLPLTYWPYIVGLVMITALTVFLSDGSFGTRAPPIDM
uniref:Uncharacterized protein n=1 Tax=Lotharella oceanica TaxID=641309 RepID=A0A7S2TMR4_9EUKA|mmetsp:Transcript_18657/g.35223  ORF Transcript_18657/g.35223 Transcript_18657/m.35223 type:complete len:117 (+) Transcript_18657:417-767(+)